LEWAVVGLQIDLGLRRRCTNSRKVDEPLARPEILNNVTVSVLLPMRIATGGDGVSTSSLDGLLRLKSNLQIWEHILISCRVRKSIGSLAPANSSKRLLPELKNMRNGTVFGVLEGS